MMSEYRCPHCNGEIRRSGDLEEEGVQRVRHLVKHAFEETLGVEIEVIGDLDVIEYCEEAGTWADAAWCAWEAIFESIGPTYRDISRGTLELLREGILGAEVAEFVKQSEDSDEDATALMLIWIEQRYPAGAESKL